MVAILSQHTGRAAHTATVCLWRHYLAKACLTRAGRLDPSRLLPWMDPGGLFWQARLSHRDVIAMCSVARSRQSYRYRTVVWALQGGKCLESGLSNGCGPSNEGCSINSLRSRSDIRQRPDLSSTRYRPVPCRKTMQGSAYCPTPLVGRQCLVHEHITSSCSSVVQSSPRYDCRRSFQKTDARVTSKR